MTRNWKLPGSVILRQKTSRKYLSNILHRNVKHNVWINIETVDVTFFRLINDTELSYYFCYSLLVH